MCYSVTAAFDVALRGKIIGDVLAMDVDEALIFFAAHPGIAHPLKLLQDIGLVYRSVDCSGMISSALVTRNIGTNANRM